MSFDEALGYRFHARALRDEALTHRSYGVPNNERLEFLGDGVLSAVVAAELYSRYPTLQEGELSRLRASLVRENTLHSIALRVGLAAELRLGEGEARSGGRARASILADALEAVIGAIYLDGGFEAAREAIRRLYGPLLENAPSAGLEKDPKTELQEILQARRSPLPAYAVVRTSGAAHSQTFEVECVIAAHGIRTTGAGTSRRLAEQEAASKAIALLRG